MVGKGDEKRCQNPGESHLDGEGCELFLVDCSLIDGVGYRQVDHFTNKRGKTSRLITELFSFPNSKVELIKAFFLNVPEAKISQQRSTVHLRDLKIITQYHSCLLFWSWISHLNF